MTTRDHLHVDELELALVKNTVSGVYFVALRNERHDDILDMTVDEARALGHALLAAAADGDRAQAGLPLLGGLETVERLS